MRAYTLARGITHLPRPRAVKAEVAHVCARWNRSKTRTAAQTPLSVRESVVRLPFLAEPRSFLGEPCPDAPWHPRKPELDVSTAGPVAEIVGAALSNAKVLPWPSS